MVSVVRLGKEVLVKLSDTTTLLGLLALSLEI